MLHKNTDRCQPTNPKTLIDKYWWHSNIELTNKQTRITAMYECIYMCIGLMRNHLQIDLDALAFFFSANCVNEYFITCILDVVHCFNFFFLLWSRRNGARITLLLGSFFRAQVLYIYIYVCVVIVCPILVQMVNCMCGLRARMRLGIAFRCLQFHC